MARYELERAQEAEAVQTHEDVDAAQSENEQDDMAATLEVSNAQLAEALQAQVQLQERLLQIESDLKNASADKEVAVVEAQAKLKATQEKHEEVASAMRSEIAAQKTQQDGKLGELDAAVTEAEATLAAAQTAHAAAAEATAAELAAHKAQLAETQTKLAQSEEDTARHLKSLEAASAGAGEAQAAASAEAARAIEEARAAKAEAEGHNEGAYDCGAADKQKHGGGDGSASCRGACSKTALWSGALVHASQLRCQRSRQPLGVTVPKRGPSGLISLKLGVPGV